MHFKDSPFLRIPTQKINIQKRELADGTIYLTSSNKLQPHPYRMTDRLAKWANQRPETVFLGQKNQYGQWRTISYKETFEQIQPIAQWLLTQELSAERPIAVIAKNSIEHALIALAALHIGVPFSPINPMYAQSSHGYKKLADTLTQLTPGAIAFSDENLIPFLERYTQKGIHLISLQADFENATNLLTHLKDIAHTSVKEDVHRANRQIEATTIAKILFTSGSTGQPKGVINTHGNITSNWQQITQVFPFMEEGFQLVDWLPWNHTFGGNHNLGLTLYNGGSLYIDEGRPSPDGIKTSIQNLKDHPPSIYFNVPRGFEELIPHLKTDSSFRQIFFSNLKLLFYAGAGMAQHTWDELEALAFETLGKRVLISTALGCTESSPSSMFNTTYGSFAGMLGVPIAGLELKLSPVEGKLEARYKGPNIMPAYWRNVEATEQAFDDERFYKTGDALKFVNHRDPNEGMIFDGRIGEDFKLNSGTWVRVGNLRNTLIKAGNGLIHDAVITGHDRAFVGALIFLDLHHLSSKFNIHINHPEKIASFPKLQEGISKILGKIAQEGEGSASLIQRALIAPFNPDPSKGELTAKGSLNQKVILSNRASYVDSLYQFPSEESQYILDISFQTPNPQ